MLRSHAPLEHRASGEQSVIELLDRLSRHRDGRIAVHVRLSRLQPHHRREHHLRIAGEVFEEAASSLEGATVTLSCGDLVFIGRSEGLGALERAVERLCVLFNDDPLIQAAGEGSGARDARSFCSWYSLARDYDRLLAEFRALRDRGNASRSDAARLASFPAPVDERSPLGPATLGEVSRLLERADISSLARNQAVCTIPPGTSPTRVFDEIYVSISDLERAVSPNVALGADPWMFRSLTQTLDRRILAHIGAEAGLDRSISLNLNVSTLLSADFKRFDDRVNGRLRGKLILEISLVDLVADMRAFAFARESLRERGYRICIDGITHQTMHMVDRERLGADLVKIQWSPELAGSRAEEDRSALGRFVATQGRARVVLCRCDDAEAVQTGQSVGFVLFQGRHVDRMLRPGRAAA